MPRRSAIKLSSFEPAKGPQGQPLRATARTSTSARLADAAIEQIDELSKLATLGEVTALLAHELNNLLTPLLAYAQAGLAAGDDPAFREKALTKCLVHAEQATRVSQAILGLAKHEPRRAMASAAGAAAGRDSCRVATAVEASLASLARDLSKDGIELNLDWKSDVEVAMPLAELQQVLLNLILNARRALLNAPERTLTIKVRRREREGDGPTPVAGEISARGDGPIALEPETDGGGGSGGSGGNGNASGAEPWVVIKVIDSGPGMDVSGLLTAMGPRAYVRSRDVNAGITEVALRSAWTSGPWGTNRDGEPEAGSGGGSGGGSVGGGLGLVLCRRLVEACGGTLWARSTLGAGTTIAAIVPGK